MSHYQENGCQHFSGLSNVSGADETVSLGDGIECEVIQTIFVDYKRGCSEWSIEHTDQLLTIAISHSLTSSCFVPLICK